MPSFWLIKGTSTLLAHTVSHQYHRFVEKLLSVNCTRGQRRVQLFTLKMFYFRSATINSEISRKLSNPSPTHFWTLCDHILSLWEIIFFKWGQFLFARKCCCNFPKNWHKPPLTHFVRTKFHTNWFIFVEMACGKPKNKQTN